MDNTTLNPAPYRINIVPTLISKEAEFPVQHIFTRSLDGLSFANESARIKRHIEIYETSAEWYNNNHIKILSDLLQSKSIIFPYVEPVTYRIMRQLLKTEYHIEHTIDRIDWYEDITEYIEYNIRSFGHPEVGLHIYHKGILEYLQSAPLLNWKRHKLIQYLDYFQKCKDRWYAKCKDVELIVEAYNRYVDFFPDLDILKEIKQALLSQHPTYAFLKPASIKRNRYMLLYDSNTIMSLECEYYPREEMIEKLCEMTDNLLRSWDAKLEMKDATKSEMKQQQEQFEDIAYQTEKKNLRKAKLEGENEYRAIIEKWLNVELKYLKVLEKRVKGKPVYREEYTFLQLFLNDEKKIEFFFDLLLDDKIVEKLETDGKTKYSWLYIPNRSLRACFEVLKEEGHVIVFDKNKKYLFLVLQEYIIPNGTRENFSSNNKSDRFDRCMDMFRDLFKGKL